MSEILTEPQDDQFTQPNDLDAEIAVLGSMLINRDVIEEVADVVTGPEFYRPIHETVFGAILTQHWEGEPVDPVTIADRLAKSGDLVRIGGPAYLHHLVQQVVVASSATYYAEIVREHALRRRLIAAGHEITRLGYAHGEGAIADTVARAQAQVDSLAAGKPADLVTGADVLADVMANIREPDQTRYLGTPWPSLNECIVGLAPGRVYVVGARPGVGKTVVATNLALWWLQRHGKAVAFSTLEMPRQEIVLRMLASMSGVDFMALQKGGDALTKHQHDLVTGAEQQFRKLPPIFVDDREQVDATVVRNHARSADRRSNLGLVVVDYLQLMESTDRRGSENRNQEVAKFSRSLKKMARSLNVPVVVLSQLNRGSEQRGPDAPPRLSDLRDSGAVEQDADVVLLLHRPDVEGDDLILGLQKNRQGPKKKVFLTLDGPRMQVRERTRPAMTHSA